jgi:hypothetical protein
MCQAAQKLLLASPQAAQAGLIPFDVRKNLNIYMMCDDVQTSLSFS